MEKRIIYRVQIKASDLWQYSMYHSNRGVYAIFNGAFTIAALYLLVMNWADYSEAYRLVLFVCILIFPVLQPIALYRKARRQAGQPTIKEPMTLDFGEEGLTVKQLDQEIAFTWEDIGRIDKMPTQIIIFMDRIHAYLIPKSVYKENYADFSELLHGHLPKKKLRRIDKKW